MSNRGGRLLLVDIAPIMPKFSKIVSQMDEFECELPELISRLCDYISHHESTGEALQHLFDLIIEDHAMAGNANDGEILGEGGMLLGNYLAEQMRTFGIYRKDGWLGELHFLEYRPRGTVLFRWFPNAPSPI